jgi:hypothetical protein
MPRLPAHDVQKWEQAITRLIFDAEALPRLRKDIGTHYMPRSPDAVFRQIVTVMSRDGVAATPSS